MVVSFRCWGRHGDDVEENEKHAILCVVVSQNTLNIGTSPAASVMQWGFVLDKAQRQSNL
jgi:hypothetical protein